MINHSINDILKYKAKAMRTNPAYLTYVDEVLKELRIADVRDAFILGAIDAMIGGPAYSTTDTTYFKRSSMLKEIIK